MFKSWIYNRKTSLPIISINIFITNVPHLGAFSSIIKLKFFNWAIFLLINICYTINGNLPRQVVGLLNELISLVVAPIFVGIVIELFSSWLEKKDKDDN
jgi:hypothetical protein